MSTFKTSISIIALLASLSLVVLPHPALAQDAAATGQAAQQLPPGVQDALEALKRDIAQASKEIAGLKAELETETANLRHFERVRDKETGHIKEDTKEAVPETLTPDEIADGVTPQSGIEEATKEIARLKDEIKKRMDANARRLVERQEIIDKATGTAPGNTGGVQQAGAGAAQPGGEKVCRNGRDDAARIKEYTERLRQFEMEIADRDGLATRLRIDRMIVDADRDLNAVTKQARLSELDARSDDNKKHIDNLKITVQNLRDLLKALLDDFCPPSPVALPFPSSDASSRPEQPSDAPKAKPIDKAETRTSDRPRARVGDRKPGVPRDTEPQLAKTPTTTSPRTKTDQHAQPSGGDQAAAQAFGTAIGIGIGVGVGHAMGGERRMDDGMRMR